MLLKSVTVGSLLMLTGLSVHAEEFCTIDKKAEAVFECMFSSCPSEKRSLTIKFPDGRAITVIGSNHGNRDLNGQFIAELLNPKITKTEWQKKLEDFKKQHKDTLIQAKQDEEYLQQILLGSPKPVFLGIEATQEKYSELRNLFVQIMPLLRDRSKENGTPKDEIEELMAGSFSLVLYLDLTRPGWLGELPVKAFESLAAYEKEDAISSEVEILNQKVETLLSSKSGLLEKFKEDRGNLRAMRIADQLPDTETVKQIMDSVAKDPELGALGKDVAELYGKIIEEGRASTDRDKIVAARMAAEAQSGVLVVGGAHLMSLGHFLQQKCQSELKTGVSSAPAIKP